MKKILIAGCFVFSISLVQAQQKKGLVTYERVSQFQIQFSAGHEGLDQLLPKTRTDKFELTFGNNQSVWKQGEQEDETPGFSGEGMQVRMISSGSTDVLYTNLETAKRVEKREMFDKSFIVDDTIARLKWKMTGETKTILNMPCMKATSTRISTRMAMNIDNGKMERKEVQDTANIVAWFTSSIPVSAGPAEYQGQLPGLILEMDINNGRQTFKALSISEKADLALIKEPTGKKHLTGAEFDKERDRMLQEMQQNNQGGQRIIRMN
ncbi:MAG TPA: GLPGLI family protein [Chitinophagaceae bacterium]|jgi:GLPGLI family protein|nr:GLPGLI family protein [Chitinophagaceae bacterium]